MLAVRPEQTPQPERQHPYIADARLEQPFEVFFDGRWVTVTPVSDLIVWPDGQREWRIIGYYPHLYFNR